MELVELVEHGELAKLVEPEPAGPAGPAKPEPTNLSEPTEPTELSELVKLVNLVNLVDLVGCGSAKHWEIARLSRTTSELSRWLARMALSSILTSAWRVGMVDLSVFRQLFGAFLWRYYFQVGVIFACC